MDTRDGTIYRSINDADKEDRPYLKRMAVPPTARQREVGRIKRNDSCPCGSGKKFKKCCMFRVEAVVAKEES